MKFRTNKKYPPQTTNAVQNSSGAGPESSINRKAKKPARQISLRASLLISASFALIFSLFFMLTGWVILSNNNNKIDTKQSQQIISSEGEVFNKIASEVGKSVVSITVTGENGNTSAGSGVIINDQGLILTNKHVVPSGSTQIEVIDHTSAKHPATLVGRDGANDIAFIKASGLEGVPPAKLADSSGVKVGDKVLAIGNALGEFQNTVTSGIVSGIGRPIEVGDSSGQDYESLSNLIQTDAAINPGNSGGPLVNMAGEVIGINTAIVENAQSLGFSIPINDAKALIAQVQSGGSLSQRSYLGVRYISLTTAIARQLGLNIDQGALVYSSRGSAIEPGSPAEQAGLQQKDVIIKVGDIPISRGTSLPAALSKYKPGETVELTIIRDGQAQKINVTLGGASN